MGLKTLEIIIAGGQGNRLKEVSGDLPKPLVLFGAENATIDFPLSNAFNSGSTEILVLIEYKAEMMEAYLRQNWQKIAKDVGTTIKPLKSRREGGYISTADAVYQNIKLIRHADPDLVTILYADHIYSADYRKMHQTHVDQNADITVGAMQVPIAYAATRFGVFEVDEFGKVIGLDEKPINPKGMSTNPDNSLINLGIYVFSTATLLEALEKDARNKSSSHDFARDVIPDLIRLNKRVIVHRFSEHPVKGQDNFYWADIGVPEDYHRAHMDIVGPKPRYSIDNPDWPLHIVERHTETPPINPNSRILHSRVSPRSRIGEVRIINSVIFPDVVIEDYTEISDSVILPGTVIRERTRIDRSVVRGTHIGPNAYVGAFPSLSDKLDITKTATGIYIVTKNLRGN